jgi:hypothetical protein
MALQDERNVDTITYDQVRERAFESHSMATAALVVSFFSDRVKPADINSLNVARLNLDVAAATRDKDRDASLFERETGVKMEQATLRECYTEGIAVLTRTAVVPLSVVTDIELRLADLGTSHLVHGVSSFAYKHLAFPADIGEDIAPAEISVSHVLDNEEVLEAALDRSGIGRELPRAHLMEVALTGAIMHEYGHALRTYIQIKMAERAVQTGEGGSRIEQVEDLLAPQNRDYFWALFSKVEGVSSAIIMGGVSDVAAASYLLERCGALDANGVASMSHESLAQGLEYYALRHLMASVLARDEYISFAKALDDVLLRKQEDYLYYLRLCEQKGLSSDTIRDFIYSVRQGCHKAGLTGAIPWLDNLPFYAYGLGPEQAGYYYPVEPANIQSCVSQMLAHSERPTL